MKLRLRGNLTTDPESARGRRALWPDVRLRERLLCNGSADLADARARLDAARAAAGL